MPALFVFALVAGACSGSGSQCVAIVDDAIGVFQELIDAVDELDLTAAAEGGDSFVVPGLDAIEARAGSLQSDADAAGCGDDELRDLLDERIVRLEARTVFGQAVIEGIRQEGLFGRTSREGSVP